jgi:uncharacterized SAM-binding protein YcdF (DUF218 family)
MFFIAAKILGFFALPSNIFISLGIVGVLLSATRFARAGARLTIASVILLAVFGFSPIGNALIMPLEERFPPWSPDRGPPDGAVILGGVIDTFMAKARGEIALNEAAERMTGVAELARRYPNMRIIFSGGSGSLLHPEEREAVLAPRLLESFGIPRSRIVLEEDSRDTAENARFSKVIAAPKSGERWLLVTSAFHMPRSVGVFRQAGFPIEPYPVDWRTRGRADLLMIFPSISDGLRRTDVAAREWIGLLAYWMAGRTSELFPAPR